MKLRDATLYTMDGEYVANIGDIDTDLPKPYDPDIEEKVRVINSSRHYSKHMSFGTTFGIDYESFANLFNVHGNMFANEYKLRWLDHRRKSNSRKNKRKTAKASRRANRRNK